MSSVWQLTRKTANSTNPASVRGYRRLAMSLLRVGKTARPQRKSFVPPCAGDPRVGSVVTFTHEGGSVIGVFKGVTLDAVEVEIALPGSDGVLRKTGSTVVVNSADISVDAKAVLSEENRRVTAWEASVSLSVMDGKSPTPIYDGEAKDVIVDYRDVTIEGFLSTFVGTTPKDRDGDYVEDDAFNETLAEFKRNPVMLTDHNNSVGSLAGSFTKIGVNKEGLAVQGKLSNAPGMIDARFKVAEGHLKSLSMGGLFFYKEDNRGIEKVTLWEGSLTPVPANQDALFRVRSLTVVDAVKAIKSLNIGR